MTLQQAIEDAIKGGWNPNFSPIRRETVHGRHLSRYQSQDLCVFETYLDPFFWQALGKAREWKNQHESVKWVEDFPNQYGQNVGEEKVSIGICPACLMTETEAAENGECIPRWRKEWHNFIDHLAQGRDIESFFEGLK